jgi:diguanylate cyclase (GGDEF)-like protein
VLGTLCIIDLVPREFRTAERNLLRELAGLVQSTLAGRASDDSRGFTTEVVATEGESRIDPLLRIWDRRGITAVLEQLLIDPRGTQPSTMLLVAVDDFKRIHTGHGRATADKAMKAACRELRSFLRAPEEIGCFGDDAFLMTLPRTSGAAAERVARRMRDALARLRIDAPAGAAGCHVSIGFTVSIAVQEWRPETGEASASVMRRMRATLAAAKRWGGNTVLLGECLDAVASGTERPPC